MNYQNKGQGSENAIAGYTQWMLFSTPQGDMACVESYRGRSSDWVEILSNIKLSAEEAEEIAYQADKLWSDSAPHIEFTDLPDFKHTQRW